MPHDVKEPIVQAQLIARCLVESQSSQQIDKQSEHCAPNERKDDRRPQYVSFPHHVEQPRTKQRCQNDERGKFHNANAEEETEHQRDPELPIVHIGEQQPCRQEEQEHVEGSRVGSIGDNPKRDAESQTDRGGGTRKQRGNATPVLSESKVIDEDRNAFTHKHVQ